jgi:hypothetical protein
MRPYALAAVLTGLAVTPTIGFAQQNVVAEQKGTWIGASVGGGWTRVSCAICRRERDLGPAGHVRFGTTLRPGFLLGAEIEGWTHEDEEEVRQLVLGALGTVTLYPNPTGGLFFKGGLGWVRYSLSEDDDDIATNLLALMVGAGFEFRIAPGLTVTNYVSLLASSFGSLQREQASVVDDVSVSLLQIGIGLTRH